MRTNILFYFTFLFALNILAQNETNHWYFGNKAALNFNNNNNNNPKVLSNSDMFARYGSSSISDKQGNLLFYSQGSIVYNKEHKTMDNGGFLASDIEIYQPTIIIPKPNDENIYYLFTLRNVNTPPSSGIGGPGLEPGLYYSIIDVSLNNGMGKVIVKNTFLNPLVSEKLTAVHSEDGKSIWLVTFGKSEKASLRYNTFYAYKISRTGINTPPIKTTINNSFLKNQGGMKLSPNGEFLISSNFNNVGFFHFNNKNGEISGIDFFRTAHGEGMASVGSKPKVHGIAFSQDSKYAYIETLEKGTNKIFQYLTEDINNRTEIISTEKNSYSYMQLARDANIYITTPKSNAEGGDYLSIISPLSDNNKTTSFEPDVLSIGDKKSRLGLPNFIQSYFRTRILTKSGCVNNPTFFDIDTYTNITSVYWDFGDGNNSKEINPNYIYLNTGTYTVSATVLINNSILNLSKTIIVYPLPILAAGQELAQCDTDSDGISTFNLYKIKEKITNPALNETLFFYETRLDAVLNTNRIINQENYTNTSINQEIFVRFVNENDCFSISSFKIKASFVEFGKITDLFSCQETDLNAQNATGKFLLDKKRKKIRTTLNIPIATSIKFYPTYQAALTLTNEMNDEFISSSTTIWVRGETETGCGGIQSFNATVNSKPIIYLEDIYTICIHPEFHAPIILETDTSNDRFEWLNSKDEIISINKYFILTTVGNFKLKAYKTQNNIECSSIKSFTVRKPNAPIFSEIVVNTDDPTNNIISVEISGTSSYEFSINNSDFFQGNNSYRFTNVTSGNVTIYVQDIHHCEPPIQKTVSVIGFPNFFTPNNDGINDFWTINGINSTDYQSATVTIMNRFGKVVATINLLTNLGWNGSFNGEKLASSNYWFLANLVDIDDQIISKTGNFSLVRK
jgi:gliding motility-associated-like protein